MAEDPLERFRKSANTPAAALPGGDKEEYEAFKSVTRRQVRLKIRPHLRAWERIGYAYLHRIMEDGPYGKEIVLIYQFAVIVIKGRNLQLVAEAIGDENCEFVQAFDPDRHRMPSPPDPAKPFIDSIDFHVQTREAMVQATDDALSDMAKARSAPKN